MTHTVLLGDEIELIGGGTPKTSNKAFWGGEIPWLSVVDFGGGSRWVKTAEKKITELGLKNSSTKLLNTNDIIISARGTVGELAQLRQPMAFNQSCYGVRAKKNMDQNYLYYLLKFSISDLQRQAHGGVFSTITRETFQHIKITLPSLEVQKMMANILGTLDEKIELNRQMNETLEQIGQALFRHYFIDNPEAGNWEAVKIGELVDIKGGGTPSTKNNDFWDGDILWSSPRDLTGVNDAFLLDTNKKITKKGLAKVSSGLLPKGTLLLSSRAPIGYVALSGQPLAINQGYIAFLPEAKLSNYFMFFWLKYNMDRIKGAANGSTFMEISKSAFRNITTSFPDEKILKQFDESAVCYFEQMRNNQEGIQTLTTLRDTLLPRLINGKVNL